MQAREILSVHVEEYLDRLRELTHGDLFGRQLGYFASLYNGAAGLAHACWQGALLRGDEELLETAERWIRSALARQRGSLAFAPLPEVAAAGGEALQVPPGAFVFGRTGLHFTRALIAGSREDRRARDRSLTRLVELSRTAGKAPLELFKGAAGRLAACSILLHQLGAARLLPPGRKLARGLLRQALRGEDGTFLWPGLHGLGLAHGQGGVYLSLLLWSAASGDALPGWLVPSLASLLERALREPSRIGCGKGHYGRLCTGFTGLAFLAAKACEVTGEAGLLQLARRAAGAAQEHLPGTVILCCGRTGLAFTCLTLARVDPPTAWRKRATELALSALLAEPEEGATASLYMGEAGIFSLASCLAAGVDAGPPGLDFFPPPEGSGDEARQVVTLRGRVRP